MVIFRKIAAAGKYHVKIPYLILSDICRHDKRPNKIDGLFY